MINMIKHQLKDIHIGLRFGIPTHPSFTMHSFRYNTMLNNVERGDSENLFQTLYNEQTLVISKISRNNVPIEINVTKCYALVL